MNQKELHMKEFFEWMQINHDDLKSYYFKEIPIHVMENMPFTMFAIVQYCEYLDIEKLVQYKG
jgi:hypothetical protein